MNREEFIEKKRLEIQEEVSFLIVEKMMHIKKQLNYSKK